MKKWVGAFGVALLASLYVLSQRASSPGLLSDSDTHVLLATIRQRNAPWSWFGGDWPLFNHFYRPIPTLTFELDNRLYGDAAWGYGLTNALLCATCTLLLFWFLRELTDRPWLAAASTVLFASWQTDQTSALTTGADWIMWTVLIGGICRHRLKVVNYLPAALVTLQLSNQLGDVVPIGPRTLGWLPGRTATVMTVFALVALASYARFERLGAERVKKPISPLDPPATRNTEQNSTDRKPAWGWIVLCLLGSAGALASYEQAVMLPALITVTAFTLQWRGFRVRWNWQFAFWGLLGAYVIFRHAVVPSDPSKYQLQQFRHGSGVLQSILEYAFPSLNVVWMSSVWISELPLTLITFGPWKTLLLLATDISTFVAARRQWVLLLSGYALAVLAYLPMAWLKQFEHYHYLPLALKSLFVTMLGFLAWELAVSAWSPQTFQAPPRRHLAPGSLPRP